MLLDIGAGELFALVVLAAVFLGPEKVPALAKKAARIIHFLRGVANNATDQIKAELGPEYADLTIEDLKPKNLVQKLLPGEVQDEMTALRAELAAMRSEVTQLQKGTVGDLKETLSDVRDTVNEVRQEVDPKAGAKNFYDSLAEMTGHTKRNQVVEADQVSEPVDAAPVTPHTALD